MDALVYIIYLNLSVSVSSVQPKLIKPSNGIPKLYNSERSRFEITRVFEIYFIVHYIFL